MRNFCIIVLTAVCLIGSPVLSFTLGFAGGSILQACFGETIVSTINSLFAAPILTTSMIPVICGIIAVIGGFFKTNVSNSKR